MNFDERDVKTYQFLFDLPDADKQLLADYGEFSSIKDWENWVRQQLKGTMPPYALLDNIHFQYITSSRPISYEIKIDEFLDMFDKHYKKNGMKSNDMEVFVQAWISSLRQKDKKS